MDCFEVVNISLNGAKPSETAWSGKVQVIGRKLLFDINAILQGGWDCYWRWKSESIFDDACLEDFRANMMCMSAAWAFVLDGDIDSLRDELAHAGLWRIPDGA